MKVVRIKNTLELETLYISEALFKDLKNDSELNKRLNIIDKPQPMQFDVMGYLAR
jgi:hypothetical protein